MASNSITADDIFGAPVKAEAPEITADDIFGSTFKPDPHAGLSHKSQPSPPYSTDNPSGSASAALKQGLIRDPETLRQQIAASLFPNDPQGNDKVKIAADGTPIYLDKSNVWQRVTGGMGNFAASLVTNLPEMVMGGLGSVSSSPLIGGTLGVAGARGLKDAAVGLMYGEPQSIGGNLLDVGEAAAGEFAAGGLMKGALAIGNRGRSIDISPRDLAAAQAKRQAIRNTTGVDADLALVSGDRNLLSIRNWLAQQPTRAADAIQNADEAASNQFLRATSDVLDRVAANEPASTQGARGINAADAAMKSARATRDAAVEPYYTQAGKVRLPGDVVTDLNSDPLIARAAKRIASDPVYQRKLAGQAPDSVAYWQQVKRNLNAGYEEAAGSGNKTAAAEYADAARMVNEKLAAASPEYAAANAYFAKATKDTVEPLENSIVGILAKVKDTKAASVAARLFKGEGLDAGQIFAARKVIEKQDPEAWNGIVRQYLTQELNSAMKVTQGGQSVNVPGKLFQRIWGTPNQRNQLNAALGKDAADALQALMDTAEVLARAPVKGSNTQPNQAIERVFDGAAAWWARVILKPKESIVGAAQESAKERNINMVWDALSDPAKARQLKIVTRIPDPAKRAAYISAVIASQAGTAQLPRQ